MKETSCGIGVGTLFAIVIHGVLTNLYCGVLFTASLVGFMYCIIFVDVVNEIQSWRPY